MKCIDSLYSYYIYRNLINSNILRNKGKIEKFENGSVLLLWGPSAFIGGEFSESLIEKIVSVSDKLRYIYFPDEKCSSYIRNKFSESIKEKILNMYHSDCKNTVDFDDECIVRITEDFFNKNYNGINLIKDELYSYSDLKDFLKNGIGLALVINNEICGYCLSEYSFLKSHGINIRIDEKYQRMGYASKMTRVFLNLLNERNEKAYWVCNSDNIPSNKTALSSGFSLKSTMKYFEIENIYNPCARNFCS